MLAIGNPDCYLAVILPDHQNQVSATGAILNDGNITRLNPYSRQPEARPLLQPMFLLLTPAETILLWEALDPKRSGDFSNRKTYAVLL
jgi:hypothetical protein